jgi:class 3 adenylate cyclase
MALFLNLYLGHLLGDFLLQPGRLVLAKRDGVPGLLLHTLIVGAASAVVVAGTIRGDWPAVVLVTGLHLVIERLTILTYLKTPTRGLFTLLFDQTLHMLSIAVVVWLAVGWEADTHALTLGIRLPIERLAAIDGLLTVMLLGSILAFETGNTLRRGADGKGRILRFDAARVGGMLERGTALVAAPRRLRAARGLRRDPPSRSTGGAVGRGGDRSRHLRRDIRRTRPRDLSGPRVVPDRGAAPSPVRAPDLNVPTRFATHGGAMTTRTSTIVRRNAGIMPWLRALAFAGITYAALSAFGFYPAVAAPLIALTVGALGLFSPGIGVLLFLVAVGVPMSAGNVVAGALFLVLGFGVIQYLSESHGRAFLVIGLAFVATLVKAEWGVAVLAGYLLGASGGAVVALVACLVIQGAGLLIGAGSIGSLATGGVVPPLVDLKALAEIKDPLTFAWLLPSITKIDPASFFKAVSSAKDLVLLAVQPLLWAGAAAIGGLLAKPVGDPKRPLRAIVATGAGVAVLGAASIGLSAAVGGPVPASSLALGLGASLVVALAGAGVSEWVFAPSIPEAPKRGTSAEDADVDELLRMISTAEEELASKHTAQRTVLITDMKSFSRMTQELGSTETAKLVQRHRDLLLPIVEQVGGRGKSTGGDGLLAAFEDSARALEAAVKMQQALAAYNASRSGEDEVLIRAGIATGEVVLDKGGKPFLGDALNLAARIMSLADGGQVFTTDGDVVRAGALPFGSVEHGEFRLKNIAVPVRIIEVLWREDQQAVAPHTDVEP